MKTYFIEVSETLSRVVEVQAEDSERKLERQRSSPADDQAT